MLFTSVFKVTKYSNLLLCWTVVVLIGVFFSKKYYFHKTTIKMVYFIIMVLNVMIHIYLRIFTV